MKLIQAMIKLCVSIMITSLVCVVCTFTVMNAYIDMVLDQYQLKSTAIAAPNWSQFMAHLGKQAQGYRLFGETKLAAEANGSTLPPKAIPTTQGATQQQEDALAVFGHQQAVDGSAEPLKSEPESKLGSKPEPEAKPNASAANGTIADASRSTSLDSDMGNSPANGSRSSSSSSSTGSPAEPDILSGAGGKVVVSGEEFTKKKEQLSNDDKNQIFKLLTRVPQAEIQHISLMMEDGITASELSSIEKLLQNYLKPEEYSQLLGMIKPL
ncbi:hypothetical protein [Paenibacillus agricola]|uniref:Uncharacterized protein n=1 Tax=Paenibacillus agricola TaxID=2716264 RepID=A0ABX0JAE3_9BACL|nr:hypothetical protein [Paenibacillus agricola]NHN32251.1 hypothetical protein [Paenibacillus agricola]